MANRGAGTNTCVILLPFSTLVYLAPRHSSQFYFTFRATPNLDGKHTVFGKLVGGEDILDALEKLPRKDGTERPSKPIKIKEIVMYVLFCLLCV